jgi:NitT/TauT family transport system ATP-binding protein
VTATAPPPASAGTAPPRETLIGVRSVSKSFAGPEGRRLKVLEGIDLDVAEGEFVALLGRSGSGKSTLLRCIAGLIAPTQGTVEFRGKRLTGTNRQTAMVFQTFALLPWLTVQQNVEIGLESRGVAVEERSKRALRVIDIVGLDGYETAFPKELSGGMRQRVGFARALVVEPDVLLMDEPFSALDVLTAENLRGELLELWEGKRFPTKAIVMVTHNIEEAVLLADRILVLGTNPGRIKEEIHNTLSRPRQRRTPDFDELVDHIYQIMTERAETRTEGVAAPRERRATPGDAPLPHATVDGLSGLAEIVHNRGDGADLADLAEILGLEVDDLLPLVDALVMLGFAAVEHDHLRLTPDGAVFAGANIQDSKAMFARAAMQHAPLVRTIDTAVRGCQDGNLPRGFFLDVLHRSFGEAEAEHQLQTAINWGRYAELYGYDASRGQIICEDHSVHHLVDDHPAPLRRGALRLYLGAAPGSGKTYAMLREGHDRRAQGADVVVGIAETHGRPRTAEVLEGLEVIPRRRLGDGPDAAEEMDVDAVIARKPQVALVDDLAHRNAPGSRYPRRAEDVAALRDAGIDVVTTLDVRNVESVKDLVEGITGAGCPETLPDEILEDADEVQFVDIAPEALRKRLSHGNIQSEEDVDGALERMFRPESLSALREIALRLVAESVAHQRGVNIEPQAVVVAVRGGDGVEPLIRRGARLARRTSAPCTVLAVVSTRDGATVDAALTTARAVAEQVGAAVVVREGDDVAHTVQEVVRELGADHLVIGASRPAGGFLGGRATLVDKLVEALPDVDVHVLAPVTASPAANGAGAATPGEQQESREPAPRRDGQLRIYLGCIRGSGTTTAMLEEARRRRARGTDIVVGSVSVAEPRRHSGFLGGLDLIGDGRVLDADAVLARNPRVVCVDDLDGADAHGPDRVGSVERLLDAGITVIATLHFDDLRSTEASSPDSGPRTRLDDSVLDKADDIELVDVIPSVLVDRLRRGDVVNVPDVDAALKTEFSPERLAALREQTLRVVARYADRQLVAYMHEGGVGKSWEVRPRVLACVPPRPGMEGLIRRAAALAGSHDADFRAATVTSRAPSGAEAALLESYATLTRQLGGEFAALTGSSVGRTLAEHAQRTLVTEAVVMRGHSRRQRRATLRELLHSIPEVDVHVLPAEVG